MDRAQVSVFKQRHQVGFGSFLQRQNGRSLEAKVVLEILRNLANQALKGEFADQEVGAFLVSADLAQGDGARAIAVRLFHSTSCWRRLAGGFGRELFAWGFASSGLSGSLLGAGHLKNKKAGKSPSSLFFVCFE